MREHKIINFVDAQDAVTMSYAEATYTKRDREFDTTAQNITSVADPTNPQDVATMNYVDSALTRKMLDNYPIVFTRTSSGPFKIDLYDAAGLTLELVFTLRAISIVDGIESHIIRSTTKSTHIVSAN